MRTKSKFFSNRTKEYIRFNDGPMTYFVSACPLPFTMGKMHEMGSLNTCESEMMVLNLLIVIDINTQKTTKCSKERKS